MRGREPDDRPDATDATDADDRPDATDADDRPDATDADDRPDATDATGAADRPDAPERIASFRVGASTKALNGATLGVLLFMTIGMFSVFGVAWVVGFFTALAVFQTLTVIAMVRWRVDTDDHGVTIQQGFKPERHVPWSDISAVERSLPPRIELADGDELRLTATVPRRLLHRVADHLGEETVQRRRQRGSDT